MKQWKPWRLGATLAVGLTVTGGALATSLTHMHVDDMSGAADTVIVGTVESQETVRDGNAINTIITFTVEDAITGQPGSSVEVLVPGGSIASSGIRVGEVNAGVGMYGVGSESVMFLSAPNADGQRSVLGFSQGQFAVVNGMVAVADLNTTISLEDFKTRIRANATP